MSTDTFIVVMDEPCEFEQARALAHHYRSVAKTEGYIEDDRELRMDFESDGGLWIGGDLPVERRKALALSLERVRRPFALEVDICGDPFAPDFFEREPDAWLVFGGTDGPVQVRTVGERDAEIERRRNSLRSSC
jgi:hypothetical protein